MVKAQLSPQKKNPPTRRTKRSHKRLVIHRALEHEYGHRNGNRHREWSQSNFLSKKITHQLGELNTLTKDLQIQRALKHECGHRNGNRHREWSMSSVLS